jgi:hypothetical protein
MKRVHRTFFERLGSQATYQCRECRREENIPRRFRYHFGPYCRCPQCGTYHLTRLRARDRIDPMYTGFLNFCERVGGGRLHHCCFCRIQFYDRRRMSAETSPGPAEVLDSVNSDAG